MTFQHYAIQKGIHKESGISYRTIETYPDREKAEARIFQLMEEDNSENYMLVKVFLEEQLVSQYWGEHKI